MDRPCVFLERDEVERGVGLVEQRLRLERLERDDLEAPRAGDAELGLEEVDRGGFFGGDVEFLESWSVWDGSASCSVLP